MYLENKINIYAIIGIVLFYASSFFSSQILVGFRLLDTIQQINVDNIDFSLRGIGTLTFLIPYFLNKYIFSLFNFYNINILTIFISTFIIFHYFRKCEKPFLFIVLLYLSLPAFMMSLNIFCKEFIFISFIYLFIRDYPVLKKKYLYIYLIFRPHYLFIIYFFSNKKIYLFIFLFLLLLIYRLEIAELFIELVYRKNYYLYNTSVDIANSQIKLLDYEYQGLFFLIKNIFYVLLQTNFPIFFFSGIKIIFLQIYILILYTTIIYNFNIFSKLVLFILFFFSITDVDLGQYLRHISSIFLIYPLILFKNEKY